MEVSEIRKKVLEIVSEVMEVPVSVLNDDSSNNTVEYWDSMSQMSLISALQEGFGIEIANEDAVRLFSVRSIVSYVTGVL